MVAEDHEGDLELSCRHVGRLYPVLLDRYGNIIDGNHRLAADRNWPRLRLEHISSKKDLVLARLVSNVCRRRVSDVEKTALLRELGEIHLKEGVSHGRLAGLIAEETGMSYRWVMKYLPDDLKERPGIGGPKCSSKSFERASPIGIGVARYATAIHGVITSGCPKVLEVKDYANTDFVHIVMDRKYYSKIERLASQIGTTPDVMINGALTSLLRKVVDDSDPVPQSTVVLREMC
jgi:hypothetical protein